MPIYEYRCSSCERSFEALVRAGEALARCPHCDGSALTREMSTFAARAGNGDSLAAAAQAIAGAGNPRGGGTTGGGCCGGGCGCH